MPGNTNSESPGRPAAMRQDRRSAASGSEEANGAVLARLRVGLLAERDRPLDKQGLLADVSPPQTERFTRTKTRIRKDGDECRVAPVERCAHRLDRAGRKRLHLLPPRRPRLLHAPGRIRRDVPAHECVLQDRAEQIHRMSNCNGTGPRCQAVGLPTPDDFRRDLTQRDRAEVRTEVMVVKARVVKSGLRCERGGMRRGPRAGHVLAEGLGAGVALRGFRPGAAVGPPRRSRGRRGVC